MAHKLAGQASFVEAFLRPGVGANRRLERIERMIDWAPLAVLVEPVRSGVWGRPSYPPLLMLKALLLQRWYSLSDEGLEEALSDRLSFRRFCGFALDDETPDAKTLCRFRLALVAAELPERLFAELDRQLAAKGLFVKTGTLIDASLIEADVKRPPKDEGEVAARDPDAGFTRRGQRSFFGYKAHVAVAQGTDLIRGAILTGADVGDSLVADALIQGDERAVYADKAYDSRARREALAEAGIGDALMHRRHPRRRQPAWQKWMNVALTPIRCQVERLFGLMKRSYGYRRVRYRGLDRNRAQLLLMCMAITCAAPTGCSPAELPSPDHHIPPTVGSGAPHRPAKTRLPGRSQPKLDRPVCLRPYRTGLPWARLSSKQDSLERSTYGRIWWRVHRM